MESLAHHPTDEVISPSSMTTVNQAADGMLKDLELSPLTKQTYFYGVKAFIRFLHLSEEDDEAAEALAPYPLDRISEETLSAFNHWLREAYPDPRAEARGNESARGSRTTRTYLVAAKHLMNWLDLHELLPEDVSYDRMLRRIKGTRGRKRQGYRQRKIDPDVMKMLTHYIEKPLPKKRGMQRLVLLRNRALVAFLYDTGARISEALALTREDVLDGRAEKVRLVETKNGKPRTVFLSKETRQLLQSYVRERKDSVYAPLFVSHGRDKGTAITPSHAWLLIKKAARAEGLYENTSPHSLRHRRAQDLLDEGMPLEWVAALLGHEHPDTTRTVYAWETDEERLADMLETYGLDPSEAGDR
ncbi:MAG: tyrosine-type recombinase/integrase [Anaerolineales bacterium]